MSRYLYGAFDFISLSCHVSISERIHKLYFLECQGTSSSKQELYLISKLLQGSGTHNHLVQKNALNHLPKATKWVSWIVSRYLYGAFDCMSLSCPIRILEGIHTLYFPECLALPYPNKSDTWNLSDCNGTRNHKHLVPQKILNHLTKLTKCFSWIWVGISTEHLTVRHYNVP